MQAAQETRHGRHLPGTRDQFWHSIAAARSSRARVSSGTGGPEPRQGQVPIRQLVAECCDRALGLLNEEVEPLATWEALSMVRAIGELEAPLTATAREQP